MNIKKITLNASLATTIVLTFLLLPLGAVFSQVSIPGTPVSYGSKQQSNSRLGKENFKVKQVDITVIPPFWKTTWFDALAILVSLSVIYFIFRVRIQTIKRQQEQKLQLHKVRDKIARDLHDDVGASLSSMRMYSEAVRSAILTL